MERLPEDVRTLMVKILRRRLGSTAADDLLPDAVERVGSAQAQLARDVVPAYAAAVARNLATDELRRRSVRARAHPRLYDPRVPPDPAEAAIRNEEHAVIARVMSQLDDDDRDVIYAHDVGGEPLEQLAAARSTNARAVAVRLSRVRARIRVDYVVAFRRVSLPTPSCRSVLVAVSAGDQKRQIQLGAGSHLATCAACAQLAPEVVARRRPLFAIPFLAGIRRLVRNHPGQAGAVGATAAAAVAVTALALANHSGTTQRVARPPVPGTSAPATPAPRPLVVGPTGTILPLPPRGLGHLPTEPVAGQGVPVLAVPANEGFWIGTPQQHLWVRLVGRGESPVTVVAGQHVSFFGTLATNDAAVIDQVDDADPAGLPSLRTADRHIDVPYASIRSAP